MVPQYARANNRLDSSLVALGVRGTPTTNVRFWGKADITVNAGAEISMKLYVTYTSPYARLARIVVIEKALEECVEIIEAKTRTPGSAYYQINPSGRVPYLIDEAGVGMEDSQLILPISTASMVSLVSTSQYLVPTSLTCGSNLWRAACVTAFPCGREKWLAPRTSVPPQSSPMKWPGANAWRIFLRVT